MEKSGKRKAESGKRKAESGKRKAESGKRKAEGEGYGSVGNKKKTKKGAAGTLSLPGIWKPEVQKAGLFPF